jgi:hypothetical protein
MENNHSFEYTYSAQQQKEVEAIRKKYLPKEEDKMEQLRKLHYSATQKAQAASIAAGVLGTLILGTGMSVCMTELGAALGHLTMVIGIVVGILGLVMVALAFPLYNYVLGKERQRIAPEILQLSEELLK